MSLDLTDVMHRATDSMPIDSADTDRLVDGALVRGAAQVRRHRRRLARLTAGVAGAAVLAALVVPTLVPDRESAVDRSTGAAAPGASSTLRMVPADELSRRFAAILPGSSTELSVPRLVAGSTVMIERQLTNRAGETGYVTGGFSVFEPLSAAAVASNKASCREAQRKVGPLDGTDCVLVPGGMVELWDDAMAPEDPAGFAPGIRLAWVHLTRWEGASAVVRALNSTAVDVPPDAEAPVVRTAELVELVQELVWYDGAATTGG